MNKRDKNIIAANPDMTPIELHQVGGLSKAGYEELVAMGDKPLSSSGTPEAKPGTLRPSPNAMPVNNPVLQPVIQHQSGKTQRMRAVDGSGNAVHLNPRIAARLEKMHPNLYKKA